MIDQAYKQKSKIKYGIVLSSVGIMCAIFIYTNALWAAQILSKKTFFSLTNICESRAQQQIYSISSRVCQ